VGVEAVKLRLDLAQDLVGMDRCGLVPESLSNILARGRQQQPTRLPIHCSHLDGD
jgi:hypothetical protein